VKVSTETPEATGMIAAPVWPSGLAGRQIDEIVDHPDHRDHDRARQDRAGLVVPGQEDRAADQHRHQHREPAELRVGNSCRLRSLG
jgi:hypothetical protein